MHILLITFLGMGLLFGCEDAVITSVNVIENEAILSSSDQVSTHDDKNIVNPLKQPPPTQASPLDTNCTIRQFIGGDVVAEYFYCKVEKVQLYIFSTPKNPSGQIGYIGRLDHALNMYTIRNPSSPTLMVRGKVSVHDNRWEFIPYQRGIMMGPRRIEVIID